MAPGGLNVSEKRLHTLSTLECPSLAFWLLSVPMLGRVELQEVDPLAQLDAKARAAASAPFWSWRRSHMMLPTSMLNAPMPRITPAASITPTIVVTAPRSSRIMNVRRRSGLAITHTPSLRKS
jgi:hypothetical protein